MLWWTAQHLAVAALLAAVVWLTCRLGRLGPAARHALWLVVLIKLVTPPLVTWPWGLAELTRLVTLEPADEQPAAVAPLITTSVDPPTPVERPDHADEPPFGVLLPAEWDSPTAEDGLWTADAEPMDDADAATSVAMPIPPAPAAVPRPEWSAWLHGLALGLWLAGGLIVAALHGVRIFRMLGRVRRAEPADAALEQQVDELAQRLRIRRPRLLVVPGIESPAVWALARPTLFWPAALKFARPAAASIDSRSCGPHGGPLSAESARGLIVHELAHLRRRDHWVGWLELAASCVWWWNSKAGVGCTEFRFSGRSVLDVSATLMPAKLNSVHPTPPREP